MRTLLVSAAAALLVAASGTAHASWYVAKSKHFVIYSDDNPKALHDFATRLERFDAGVRVAISMDDPPVGDGNRLTVFVMPSEADVRAIVGDKTGSLAGFYTGRISGSLAYVPKRTQSDNSVSKEAVFFHEYTHHLMMENLSAPYPEWYVEGFAEFFSTPKFDNDGSVWFGAPPMGRAWGLLQGPKMPVQSLFAGMRPDMNKEQRDVFYGRGWLLADYLLMQPNRRGQLTKYVLALAAGQTQSQAVQASFGDLAQLDKELNGFLGKPLLQFKIGAAKLNVSDVDVEPMSPGAGQVVLTRARVKFGAKGDGAEMLAGQVRGIEAHSVGDELVESTLAEAELNAGRAAAAKAAAERALATNPRNTEALVLKGKAMEALARDADFDERKKLFEDTRQTFIAANKIDTEDPEPLYEFYWSFLHEGVHPNANAMAALHYASDLAPQDIGARMNSAIAYLEEGKLPEARSTLTVVAYSPHADEAADVAKRMIADIDAGNGKAALAETHAVAVRPSSWAPPGFLGN